MTLLIINLIHIMKFSEKSSQVQNLIAGKRRITQSIYYQPLIIHCPTWLPSIIKHDLHTP